MAGLDARHARSGRSGGGGGAAIRTKTVIQPGVFAMAVSGILLIHMTGVLIVIANMETQSGGLDVAVAPQKESAEDGLSHEVKDTIENTLGIGGNDVATLAEAPGDGVEKPKEDGPDAAHGVRLRDIVAECGGIPTGRDGDGEGDP